MKERRTPGRPYIGSNDRIKTQKYKCNRTLLKSSIVIIASLIIILYLYQVAYLIEKSTINETYDSQNTRVVRESSSVDSQTIAKNKIQDKKEHDNINLSIPRRNDDTRSKNDTNHDNVDNLEEKGEQKKKLGEEKNPLHEKGEGGGNASNKKYQPILKAHIEDTNQAEWDVLPLPTRRTKSTDLKIKEFPKVSSCTKLTEQWPIDEEVAPTNSDPFLPWIHDVFPTADGKFIQFVAQNKRRCQTGEEQTHIKEFMQPNVALFQHVPVKRIKKQIQTDGEEQRYRLSTHEEADKDGVETRFICRFKPSMEETLSVFNFNYDYNTYRKAYLSTFTKEGFDVHIVWNSQHLFRCPVPESLQETIRSGSSVLNDYATQFVDLIPIRTPPRYIFPKDFLPPRFGYENKWNATENFGSNHILPRVEDSGRWENIPICKPSLMTYPDDPHVGEKENSGSGHEENDRHVAKMAIKKEKKHKLIACTWTSAGFHTRGRHTYVNDGSQRLLQWLVFHKLVGVDHVYIYDNSASSLEMETLKPITDLFPGFVTRINWPCKVCNNNSRRHRNKGERSSQYAAESSCRLRFGPHSDWLSSFDTDEYPVPMASYDNLKDFLNDMDKEDIRIVNFASMRSKPRLQLLNSTRISESKDCFDPSLPKNKTFLEVYNCNRERPPRKALMAAEKQIYRTDYVLLHFVHYSAITTVSAMSEEETKNVIPKENWKRRYKDAHTRYANEITEATMLHTKAIVTKETCNWEGINKKGRQVVAEQRVGIEFPENAVYDEHKKYEDNEWNEAKFLVKIDGKIRVANCFPIKKIDDYWVPKLNAALEDWLW